MRRLVWLLFYIFAIENASANYSNSSLDPSRRQLLDFKLRHPKPIGVLTTSAGKPVEVREAFALNNDVFNNAYFYDLQTSIDRETVPERVVHSKGAGAYGYFEVTNDVSKYTSADVFNGIGKKTPTVVRFSYQLQNKGGVDLVRETISMSVKFYTQEGNLDLLCLDFPIYLYRDANVFSPVLHAFKRNPQTFLFDVTNRFDFATLTPDTMHTLMWLFSDYGVPNGYRKLNAFAIHTYELNNKHGESHYVRFNFRSEQGIENLSDEAAGALRGQDPDYSTRDLYNAITTGNFPSWRLEMDIMPKDQLNKHNFNPFDVTRTWENGTYHTVTIGRLVLNRNQENYFKDVEQTAFNPGNLVPGIPGPRDLMYRTRRMAYRDAHSYRLGINHNRIKVNCPLKSKVYNRDGVPPVLDNMRDAPNYYQNSFNGPVPFVDAARPKQYLLIYDRNAVDFQPPADFYNTHVITEGHRDRMAANIARVLIDAVDFVQQRTVTLFRLVDGDLGRRLERALVAARAAQQAQRPALTAVSEYPRTLNLVPKVAHPSPPSTPEEHHYLFED